MRQKYGESREVKLTKVVDSSWNHMVSRRLAHGSKRMIWLCHATCTLA